MDHPIYFISTISDIYYFFKFPVHIYLLWGGSFKTFELFALQIFLENNINSHFFPPKWKQLAPFS